MVFSSYSFLFLFLPTVLLAYFAPAWLLRGRGARGLKAWRAFVLLALSYLFYGWARYWYVFLILGSTLLDLCCGRLLATLASQAGRRAVLMVSIVSNLGLLGYFKYRDFALQAFLDGAARVGLEVSDPGWARLVLPVGISFYTFQSMSYTIDVYRGVVAPLPWRRSFDFVTYVALFPQLVAGPIVRFRDLADQLRDRVHALDRFGTGVFIFMLGFAKKILIANRVGPMADALFAAPDASFIDAWAGMTSYAIQIYFDFSGYSDMAIGLGMMFGFVFPRNFDGPYRAESITEFWRRWHISLSTWLRDYLYLPLGGNRNGAWRTYRNLGLTMILGGLWHGAAWTFILWGAWHGLLLAAERMAGKRSFLDRAPRGLRVAFTFVLVILGWVLFRAPDLEAARSVYAGLFGAHGLGDFGLCGPYSARLPLMTLAMGLGVAFFGRTTERLSLRPSNWTLGLACMVFAVALLELLQSRFNPFLYYQF